VEAVAKPAAAVQAVVAKAKPAVAQPAVKAKRVAAKRRVRKAPMAVVAAVKKSNKRAVKTAQRAGKAAAAATATQIERTNTMTYDFNQLFAGFQMPGADRFQTLFADAGSRSQQFVAKSQKAAEGITDLAKANVEAMVEAGRIAVTGAKTIGQDAIASSREGLEQASQSIKSLSDAESPTEFFQLQSELARASFDRMVAESSKLTEQFVKLAGEAVQPLSNRASLNAERINELMA
jgi:phasin family protein